MHRNTAIIKLNMKFYFPFTLHIHNLNCEFHFAPTQTHREIYFTLVCKFLQTKVDLPHKINTK